MRTGNLFIKAGSLGLAAALIFGGCSGTDHRQQQGSSEQEMIASEEPSRSEAPKEEAYSEVGEPQTAEAHSEVREPQTAEADWSEYFDGMNGAAVLYDAPAQRYTVYNASLAGTRRSPCSTFKIISSLIGLESGVIDPGQSTRTWSGETFWNENWNRDIDFDDAFRASCVWYFRKVTDEIGQERMQEEIDRLSYGNCDISDWEGNLNTNNGNRALTGFWIESSLAISPKEQTEVMERIFGEASVYSSETREELKRVMLVQEDADTDEDAEEDVSVYGKTGMGMAYGTVVDAWFTGFAERGEERVYFCVYLGQTDGKDVSSAAAKEIAIRLADEYFNNENSDKFSCKELK